MGMYAKLMSRITESSLMDEDIPVRYCFVMLLAIADPQGYVVGTDIAISRRLNMPLEDFRRCIHQLMQPDPDSNSKEEEGRRVIESDCERGYFLVNYRKYRDTRDEEQRREWMREYMRKYRAGKTVADVNNGKQGKPPLAKEEAEVEGKGKEEGKEKNTGFAVPACFENVDGFTAALSGWIEHRKKLKSPATGRAIQLLLNKLSEHPSEAIAALDAIVLNGWKGFEWHWVNRNGTGSRKTFKEEEQERQSALHKTESRFGI